MNIWIILAIAGGVGILIAIIFIVKYNSFVKLDKKVEEAFSTMDIYLVKRWELVPKLVEVVKGYSAHEKDTLEQVVMLRNTDYRKLSSEEKLRTNEELASGLGQILVTAESYPALRSSENYLELSRSLYQIEDEIAQSRKYYNGCVRMLNTKVETFPGSVIAAIFGFTAKPMFQAEEIQRSNIRVGM